MHSVCGAEELLAFEKPEYQERYHELSLQLRCLVCQNQSIAESNAGLAQDLRKQIHTMLHNNKTDAEIVDFMVQRYGDFVLYDPPIKATTVLLWFGPFLLVSVLGLSLVVFLLRRTEIKSAIEINVEKHKKAVELLKQKSNGSNS